MALTADQIRREYDLKQAQIRATKSPEERAALREQISSLQEEYKRLTGAKIPANQWKRVKE
jgi:hypothetical protein